MPPAPLVPLSSLRPLLVAVVAAAFFVMGMVAISWVVRLTTAQWLAASLATAAMGGVTARVVTRSAIAPAASVGRTVGWAILLGLADVPVSFVAASLVDRSDLYVIPGAALALIIGAPFGLTLGLAFGLALSIPVAALMRAWQRPSPDASDVAVSVIGLWLALAVGVAALLVSPGYGSGFPLWPGQVDPQRCWIPHGSAWILGGLGTCLAAVASVRRGARRGFVARVTAGRVPAWRVAAASSEHGPLEPLPCLGGTAADCDHLLLRCESPGQSAYRRAETEWPVAWVPRAWLGR